jgi:hypothetical protein
MLDSKKNNLGGLQYKQEVEIDQSINEIYILKLSPEKKGSSFSFFFKNSNSLFFVMELR